MVVLPSRLERFFAGGRLDTHGIVLVADIAEDLLQNVFQSDQAGDSSELIHHQRQVSVALAEFVDQLIEWFGLGHHHRLTDEAAQAKGPGGAAAIVRESALVPNAHQIFVVDNPDDLFGAVFINRNARKLVFGHHRQHLI